MIESARTSMTTSATSDARGCSGPRRPSPRLAFDTLLQQVVKNSAEEEEEAQNTWHRIRGPEVWKIDGIEGSSLRLRRLPGAGCPAPDVL